MTLPDQRQKIVFEGEDRVSKTAAGIDDQLRKLGDSAESAGRDGEKASSGWGKFRDQITRVAGPAKTTGAALGNLAASASMGGSALRAATTATLSMLGPLGMLAAGVTSIALGFWDQAEAADAASDALRRQAIASAEAVAAEAKTKQRDKDLEAIGLEEEAAISELEHRRKIAELRGEEEESDELEVQIAEQRVKLEERRVDLMAQLGKGTLDEVAAGLERVDAAKQELKWVREIQDARLEAAGLKEIEGLGGGGGGGGKSSPRFKALEAERDIALKRLAIAEQEAQIQLSQARSVEEMRSAGEDLLAIERRRLEVQQAYIDALPARTKQQQHTIAMAQLDLEAAKVRENEEARQRYIAASSLAMDRRLGAAEAAAQREREITATTLESQLAGFEGVKGKEAEAHSTRMSQIRAERDAQIDALAAREDAVLGAVDADPWQQNEDLKQIAHEKEMARMHADIELRREVAAESQRIADEQAAALQRQIDLINSSVGAIESVHGQLTSKISDWRAGQRQAEQEQLDAWVANQNARTQAQTQQLDKQIAAASGNARKQGDLQRKRNDLEKRNQIAIEKARAKHADRQERQERRSKGISMLLEGALATVRAATAYPNIPEMVALAAAAAIAFSFGAAVLAGGTPGAGGGVGAVGAGADQGSGSERQYIDAQKTPGSAAAEKQQQHSKKSASPEGGTVYNGNVTYYANGSIDQDAAEQYAMAVSNASRTREGVTK